MDTNELLLTVMILEHLLTTPGVTDQERVRLAREEIAAILRDIAGGGREPAQ